MERSNDRDAAAPTRRLLRALGHMDRRRLSLTALLVVLVLGAASAGGAQPADLWPSLQGGPTHPGAATGRAPAAPLRLAWRGSTRVGALSGAAVGPGMVLATARSAVVALDPETGQELWRVPRAAGQLIPPAIAPEAGSAGMGVFVEGSTPKDGALVAIELDTRQRSWRIRLGGLPRSAPSIDGGAVFVGSRDRFLYAVDLEAGTLTWRARLDGFVDTSPAVAGGRVFAISEDSTTGRATLFGLDSATGDRSWQPFAAPGFSAGVTSPTVDGDTLYAGFGDLQIRAFDVSTGRVRWSSAVRSDFSPVTAPAVDGGRLFVADGTGGLYRIDPKTGDLRWEYQFPSFFIWASPLVAGDDVFVATQDGEVASVNATTGHRVWRRHVAAPPAGPLVPAGGRLLVPLLGRGGGMIALEHDPGGAVGDSPSPTTLRPGVALATFAAAFALVGAGALLLGSTVLLRREAPVEEPRTAEVTTGADSSPDPGPDRDEDGPR